MADREIEKSEKGGAERPKNPRSPHTIGKQSMRSKETD